MAAGLTFDTDLLKALGHPLRLRILEAITEKGEASPVGLSREFRVPLATVSHHSRVLRDLGWIEVARTEPRRGAVEHFYRAVTRPFIGDTQWQRLSLPMRRGLAAQTLRDIFVQAARAGGTGGFDDAGACVARMPLELDERGWHELSDMLADVLRRTDVIQQRSDARTSRRPGQGTSVPGSTLALLHFRVSAPTESTELTRQRQRERPRLP